MSSDRVVFGSRRNCRTKPECCQYKETMHVRISHHGESLDSSDRKPSPEDNVVQAIARDLPTVRWTRLARKRYRSTGGFTLFYPRQWSLRFYCREMTIDRAEVAKGHPSAIHATLQE